MIRGAVFPNRQALVAVELLAAAGQFQPFEFVLDTGFNGDLSLPSRTIRTLSTGRRTSSLGRVNKPVFPDWIAYNLIGREIAWPEMLSDQQWSRLAPALPGDPSKGGRPPLQANRGPVEGIRWIARTGASRRDCPRSSATGTRCINGSAAGLRLACLSSCSTAWPENCCWIP